MTADDSFDRSSDFSDELDQCHSHFLLQYQYHRSCGCSSSNSWEWTLNQMNIDKRHLRGRPADRESGALQLGVSLLKLTSPFELPQSWITFTHCCSWWLALIWSYQFNRRGESNIGRTLDWCSALGKWELDGLTFVIIVGTVSTNTSPTVTICQWIYLSKVGSVQSSTWPPRHCRNGILIGIRCFLVALYIHQKLSSVSTHCSSAKTPHPTFYLCGFWGWNTFRNLQKWCEKFRLM